MFIPEDTGNIQHTTTHKVYLNVNYFLRNLKLIKYNSPKPL